MLSLYVCIVLCLCTFVKETPVYASLTLAQDKSTKLDDKAWLVGYICKWSQSKITG